MEKISILLVDNPTANTMETDAALKEAGLNFTLYFAGNGKNGLDILMGDPYHELIASEAYKIKPNVVILSKELKDLTSIEFLSIVGKYYSLKDIKVFLLSDSLTEAEQLVYEHLGVHGYLQRPLDKDQIVKQILPQLNNGRTHLALFPLALNAKPKVGLVTLIKSKLVGVGLGTKIAAGLASAVMVGTVAIHSAHNSINDDLTINAAQLPEQAMQQTLTIDSVPLAACEEEPISAERHMPQRKEVPAVTDSLIVLPPKIEAPPVIVARSGNARIGVEACDSLPD